MSSMMFGGGVLSLFYAAMLFVLSRRVALVSRAGGLVLVAAMGAFLLRAVLPMLMPFIGRFVGDLGFGFEMIGPAGWALVALAAFVVVNERRAS